MASSIESSLVNYSSDALCFSDYNLTDPRYCSNTQSKGIDKVLLEFTKKVQLESTHNSNLSTACAIAAPLAKVGQMFAERSLLRIFAIGSAIIGKIAGISLNQRIANSAQSGMENSKPDNRKYIESAFNYLEMLRLANEIPIISSSNPNPFLAIANKISILSAPFIGYQTYKAYEDRVNLQKLITNLKAHLKEGMNTQDLKNLGNQFLKIQNSDQGSSLTFDRKGLKKLTESLGSDKVDQFITLMTNIESGKELNQVEIKQAKKLFRTMNKSLNSSSNFNLMASVGGALGSSYFTGIALAPHLAAITVTCAATAVPTGAAFIAFSSYATYTTGNHLFN